MEGIKILVKNNIAKVTERPSKITAGTVGLPVEFTFDGAWDGLSKTAVFKAGCKEVIVDSLEASTIVPWEVLLEPHFLLCIGVYGVNADGTEAIPTIWANAGLIHCGANPDGDPAADPTLPVWQKLLNAVGNLLGLKTKARGNLVEAVNEVYDIAYAGGIEADATLTMSGKAADAKATGDAIKVNADAIKAHAETIKSHEDAIGANAEAIQTNADAIQANAVSIANAIEYMKAYVDMQVPIAPEMQPNVEYATSERCMGKTVYTKIVSFGTVVGSASDQTKTAQYSDVKIPGTTGFANPIRVEGWYDSGVMVPAGELKLAVSSTDVYLFVMKDATEYANAYARVWYTKK